jgi:hypothetical protein
MFSPVKAFSSKLFMAKYSKTQIFTNAGSTWFLFQLIQISFPNKREQLKHGKPIYFRKHFLIGPNYIASAIRFVKGKNYAYEK